MRLRALLAFLCMMVLSLASLVAATSPSLSLGAGNDNHSLLFARNPDDFHSFGFSAIYKKGNHRLSLNLDAFTVRGLNREESPVPFKGRYDTISLRYHFTFQPYVSEDRQTSLSLQLRAGVHGRGNLGLGHIQEQWHILLDIHTLDTIPYRGDADTFRLSPLVGAELMFTIHPSMSTYGTSFGLAPTLNGDMIPGYALIGKAGLTAFLKAKERKVVEIGVSYRQERDLTGWEERDIVTPLYSGWEYSMIFDFGLLSYHQNIMLAHGTSYGLILFDPFGLWREPSWRHSDLYVSMGSFHGFDSRGGLSPQEREALSARTITSTRFVFPEAVQEPRLSLMVGMDSESGRVDRTQDQEEENRLRRSKSSLWVGLSWNYGDRKAWVQPFMTLGAGASLANFTHYRYSEPNVSSTRLFASLHAETGILILPEGMIRMDEATYQLFISAGVDWVLGFSSWTLPPSFSQPSYIAYITPLVPRIGMGIRYGVDI